MSKNQRQHRIVSLLESRAVANQAQLVELLRNEGLAATQTTVSRDLEELGAMKVRLPGGESAYALPELPSQQRAPEDHLRRILGEWVVEVTRSGPIVLLRTPPGCAHVVASAIDRTAVPGVLGTVAGDDTLLVVAAAGRRGSDLEGRLAVMAGIDTAPKPVRGRAPAQAQAKTPAQAQAKTPAQAQAKTPAKTPVPRSRARERT